MILSLTTLPPSTPERYTRYHSTWQDYIALRDDPNLDWQKISFHQGWLWVDMGKEGPNHSSFSDLITMIFGFWPLLHPEVVLQSYGRCIFELPDTHACAPDLVLYQGEPIPKDHGLNNL